MRKNQTRVGTIKFKNPRLNNETNGYAINSFEQYSSKDSSIFGIRIKFERNSKGTSGILINYHLMCAILVLVGSINFLIDPKVVPGRAGLLVTLFLVLTNFFSNAQVKYLANKKFKKKIFETNLKFLSTKG